MSLKVMVIDDSMVVRRQVAEALTGGGFEVSEAVDGMEAIACLARNAVDLIFCDVNMPRMNGLEFLEAFRATEGAPTPVVMLTTEAEPALVSQARSFGAKGWIVKPFRPELLVAAAKKLTLAAELRAKAPDSARRAP
jgi:two-component system chemotaxis response regulator CheY